MAACTNCKASGQDKHLIVRRRFRDRYSRKRRGFRAAILRGLSAASSCGEIFDSVRQPAWERRPVVHLSDQVTVQAGRCGSGRQHPAEGDPRLRCAGSPSDTPDNAKAYPFSERNESETTSESSGHSTGCRTSCIGSESPLLRRWNAANVSCVTIRIEGNGEVLSRGTSFAPWVV